MKFESPEKKQAGLGALAARAGIALVLFYFVANAMISSVGGPQLPAVPSLYANEAVDAAVDTAVDESADPPVGEEIPRGEAAPDRIDGLTDEEWERVQEELLRSMDDPHATMSTEQALEAMRTLKTIDGETGEDDLLIDFRLLNTTTLNPDPPPIYVQRLRDFDNRTIRIRGFMSPFDSLTDMRTFMLMPMPTGCYFCVPPSPKQVVLVRITSEQKVGYIYDPIEVEGKLELWKETSEDPAHQMFLYVMNDVKVKRLGK